MPNVFSQAAAGLRRGLLHAPLKRHMQKLLDHGRQLRLGRRHIICCSAVPQVPSGHPKESAELQVPSGHPKECAP